MRFEALLDRRDGGDCRRGTLRLLEGPDGRVAVRLGRHHLVDCEPGQITRCEHRTT